MPDASHFRVLFVEAPYSYGSGDMVVGKYFPLGIGYLAAFLRARNYDVRIFQPGEADDFNQAFFKELDGYDPDMVCISVMTPSYPRAAALCRDIKARHRALTVLGGHHISAVGAEALEQVADADFAAVGEGEHTLLELIQCVQGGPNGPESIQGLVWRAQGGDVVANQGRAHIRDLDALPLPARDLVDMNRFRLHSYIDFGRKSATMITSRGCPFKCMFCSSHLAMGAQYRFRSVDSIMSEIHELTERYNVDHIVFEDDTMTLKRERVEALCRALIRMPGRPTWYCLSRVDTMDFELAVLMKKAGCRMVNFGIESGSPEILKMIGKKISLDKAREAVHACNRAGLRTQCTFIVGFPFDTRDTMDMTWRAARSINPAVAIFFPLTPYPGTRVFTDFLREDQRPRSVGEWEKFLMTANTSGLSANADFTGQQIRGVADRYNRKFFMNPAKVLQLARTASGPADIMRLARGAVYLATSMIKKK